MSGEKILIITPASIASELSKATGKGEKKRKTKQHGVGLLAVYFNKKPPLFLPTAINITKGLIRDL